MSKIEIYRCDMCGHKIESDKSITELKVHQPKQFIYSFELCNTCSENLIQRLRREKRPIFY